MPRIEALQDYVSTTTAAQVLGVTRGRIWQLVREGRLKLSRRMGAQCVHNLHELEQLRKVREKRAGLTRAKLAAGAEQLAKVAKQA